MAGMTDAPFTIEEIEPIDIGLAPGDVKQIKDLLLLRARTFAHGPDISTVSRELIESFKALDNQGFLHSEARLAAEKPKPLTNTQESVSSDTSTAR